MAIVNEAAVRRWFPGQDPIGKRVNINGVTREVVGVVADVLQRSPAEPAVPMLFVPFAQRTIRSVKMVVRATGDPAALATAIRTEIRALDPDLAIADITPMTRLVARSMARPRFYTSLLSLFAAVALVLAATGVFGVMSYAVAQRAREISIRMALGALPGDVLRMIVGRALGLSAAGVVLGLGGGARPRALHPGAALRRHARRPRDAWLGRTRARRERRAGELPARAPGDEVRSGERLARRLTPDYRARLTGAFVKSYRKSP